MTVYTDRPGLFSTMVRETSLCSKKKAVKRHRLVKILRISDWECKLLNKMFPPANTQGTMWKRWKEYKNYLLCAGSVVYKISDKSRRGSWTDVSVIKSTCWKRIRVQFPAPTSWLTITRSNLDFQGT